MDHFLINAKTETIILVGLTKVKELNYEYIWTNKCQIFIKKMRTKTETKS